QALEIATQENGVTVQYLIWRNQRLKIADDSVSNALHLDPTLLITVGPALANAITRGPDLAPYKSRNLISGRPVHGKPTTVGQLFYDGQSYYVMLPDGLAQVGQVMADIIRYQKNSPPAGVVTPSEVTSIGRSEHQAEVEPEGFPKKTPTALTVDPHSAVLCA